MARTDQRSYQKPRGGSAGGVCRESLGHIKEGLTPERAARWGQIQAVRQDRAPAAQSRTGAGNKGAYE